MAIVLFGMPEKKKAEMVDGQRDPRDLLLGKPFADELIVLVAGLLRTARPEIIILAVDAAAGLARGLVIGVRRFAENLRRCGPL